MKNCLEKAWYNWKKTLDFWIIDRAVRKAAELEFRAG